jgi:hypothetical protein
LENIPDIQLTAHVLRILGFRIISQNGTSQRSLSSSALSWTATTTRPETDCRALAMDRVFLRLGETKHASNQDLPLNLTLAKEPFIDFH